MPKGLTLEQARAKARQFTKKKQANSAKRKKMPDSNDAFDYAIKNYGKQYNIPGRGK